MRKILIIFVFIFILTACDSIFSKTYDTQLVVGDDILLLNEEHTDMGCYIKADEDIRMDVKSSNLDITTIGDYLINYELKYDDILYTCSRNVKVIDSIAPEVSINIGLDLIHIGEYHVDAGVTAIDDSGFTIINVENNIDNQTVGVYEIIYTVSDLSGNSTIIIRYVTVIE